MAQKLILTFDLSGKNWKIRKSVWRELQQIGAKLEYMSHWSLPNNKRNLVDLTTICRKIRKYGGKAEIIKGEKIA